MTCTGRANIHDVHQATLAGEGGLVKKILDHHDVDINATICGATALSLALYKEKEAIFRLLLYHERFKGKIDINKASRDDWQRVEPPLVTACRLGNKEAVQLLVDSGADLNAMDNYFHTALWMATRQRNSYLASLLISRGACVNISDQWFQSPLYLAVRYAKRNDIAKILILNGSNVDIKGDKPFQWSLFYWATLYGAYDVAKLLVHAGYNVSSEGSIKKAPVQYSQEFSDWLDEELRTAPSLQRQCRAVIRKCINNKCKGKFFVKSIKQLPLPRSVIANVAMQDCIPDKALT